jgi:hypothetical protein
MLWKSGLFALRKVIALLSKSFRFLLFNTTHESEPLSESLFIDEAAILDEVLHRRSVSSKDWTLSSLQIGNPMKLTVQ